MSITILTGSHTYTSVVPLGRFIMNLGLGLVRPCGPRLPIIVFIWDCQWLNPVLIVDILICWQNGFESYKDPEASY